MRKIITLLLTILLLYSCSSDNNSNEKTVTFKVYSNNTESLLQVIGTTTPQITVKEYWTKTFKSEYETFGFRVYCEDRNTLLTGEIYINGKLKIKREGNTEIVVNLIK